MTQFEVAKLTLLPGKDQSSGGSAAGGSQRVTTVQVQFNPTSLRVQRQTSHKRGGMLQKSQAVQYPSSQAATLSFDLEFDTAEEFTQERGGAPRPVDVRTRTGPIRELVEPPSRDPAGAPSRVRFQWGTFAFQGVTTQINEDFDYFASDGTPLRAKLSLTIEEQDEKLAANLKGTGARTDRAATAPGGALTDLRAPAGTDPPPGPQPGHSGTRNPLQTVAATQGESVQQLAVRLGGEPSAWRSLMNGLDSPVLLAGGTQVDVGPELAMPAAMGVAQGFAAGVAVDQVQVLAAALGLAPGDRTGTPADPVVTSSSDVAGQGQAAGFVLSAAGGLAAAVRTVQAAQAEGEVAVARSSFTVPRRPSGDDADLSTVRTDAVDPRQLAYGRSVPLRTRAHAPTAEDARTGGHRSLAARAQPAEVTGADPGPLPPWERLPPAGADRSASDVAQRGRDARASTMRWRPGGGCR
jgi:hypothetical protein